MTLVADPKMAAALLAMASPLVPAPPHHVERLAAPPRERKPVPTCAEGGPHRYPPGRETACEVCSVTPGAAASAGLRRIEADAKLREAFS